MTTCPYLSEAAFSVNLAVPNKQSFSVKSLFKYLCSPVKIGRTWSKLQQKQSIIFLVALYM